MAPPGTPLIGTPGTPLIGSPGTTLSGVAGTLIIGVPGTPIGESTDSTDPTANPDEAVSVEAPEPNAPAPIEEPARKQTWAPVPIVEPVTASVRQPQPIEQAEVYAPLAPRPMQPVFRARRPSPAGPASGAAPPAAEELVALLDSAGVRSTSTEADGGGEGPDPDAIQLVSFQDDIDPDAGVYYPPSCTLEDLQQLHTQHQMVDPVLPGVTAMDGGVLMPDPREHRTWWSYVFAVGSSTPATLDVSWGGPLPGHSNVRRSRWTWTGFGGVGRTLYLWWVDDNGWGDGSGGPGDLDSTGMLLDLFVNIDSRLDATPNTIGILALRPRTPNLSFFSLDPQGGAAGTGVLSLTNVSNLLITPFKPEPLGPPYESHRAMLKAMGGDPVTVPLPPSAAPRIVHQSQNGSHLLRFQQCTDIVIRDLEIDGTRELRGTPPPGAQTTSGALPGHSLVFRSCKRVSLEGVYCNNAPGIGLLLDAVVDTDADFIPLDNWNTDFQVIDCEFKHNAYLGAAFSIIHRAAFVRSDFSYTNGASTMAGLSLERFRGTTDAGEPVGLAAPAIYDVCVEDCRFEANWKGIHASGAGDSGFITVRNSTFVGDPPIGEPGLAPFLCSQTTDWSSSSADCGMASFDSRQTVQDGDGNPLPNPEYGAYVGSGRGRRHLAIGISMRWLSIGFCKFEHFSCADRITEEVVLVATGDVAQGAIGSCALLERNIFSGVDTNPGPAAGAGTGGWVFQTKETEFKTARTMVPIRIDTRFEPTEVWAIDNGWMIQPDDALAVPTGIFISLARNQAHTAGNLIAIIGVLPDPSGGTGWYLIGECSPARFPYLGPLRSHFGFTNPPVAVKGPARVADRCPAGLVIPDPPWSPMLPPGFP